MEPITREEYYLAKIAGTYEGNTPEPVTIEEYYLATMAGDYSGNTPQPVTRLQYYMAKVAGVWGGSIPAPVTRLEYYWAAIASGEGKVFPPVTREEHFLVLVADAYSVVLTVVTGNPALLENSKGNRGLESLTLYGKSTQGSTPSPSYPQEIENAGMDGEIGVTVTGTNLLPFEVGQKGNGFEVFADGVQVDVDRKTDIYAVGQNNGNVESGYDEFALMTAGKYYIYSGTQDVYLYVVVWRKGKNVVLGYSVGTNAAQIEIMDGDKFRIFLRTAAAFKGKVKAMITRTPMNATSYEPYKPVQKLIVPTPNGLPGIPVSSGGNYTDEKGQQWVADEIDLAKGERVQRIGKTVVDGEKVKFVASSNSVYWNLPFKTSPGIISGSPCTSRYFADGKFWANNSYDFVWTTPGKMKPYFDTSEELNAFCVQKNSEGNPLTIYYCIETPIRTPLSPETIAAYKALRTYSPTTTVINDAGAGMSVGYAKMK